jgi:transcription elongation factor GreA
MTVQGAEKLHQELEKLKRKRPEIAKAIAEARAHGDLKENAEYHAAKELQGLAEARIRDLEGKLSSANVIDITKIPNNGRVIFGVTVHLFAVDKQKEVVYQIVGEEEGNVAQGKISINSPIARALIGKSEGDEVEVTTPAGIVTYEIIKVEHI